MPSLSPAAISPADALFEPAPPGPGAPAPKDCPHLAALIDHLGSDCRCEVDVDTGLVRLTAANGGRSTELSFGPGEPGEHPAGLGRLERLAAGSLHLLGRGPVLDPKGPWATYWPLPRELALDGDVLRSNEELIGRFDAAQGLWFFPPHRLMELRAIARPLVGSGNSDLSGWVPLNLYGKATSAPGSSEGLPLTGNHERVYLVQLSSSHIPEIKGQDLPRVRALQINSAGKSRVAAAPHVKPWTASQPPSLRVVLAGGTHIDPATGGLRVSYRDPEALAALAVEAVRTLSQEDGLATPAVPDHISIFSCYLDNGVFESFGPRFLRAAAGPQGFNQPGLSVSVRTQAVSGGTDEATGRKLVLGPGDDLRHRRPGGTLTLTLDGESVRTVPKEVEDGRSFLLDRGQDAAPLLAWWEARREAHRPAPTPGDDGPAFLMGEVKVTRGLLDRMGACELKAPTRRDAFLALRFDPVRLEAFLAARASPADTLQALRLLAQCQRAGRDPTTPSRIDHSAVTGRPSPQLAELLSLARCAADDELMLPCAVWTALWPAGQAPELSPRPDAESSTTAALPDKEVRLRLGRHVTALYKRRDRLKAEVNEAAARHAGAAPPAEPT